MLYPQNPHHPICAQCVAHSRRHTNTRAIISITTHSYGMLCTCVRAQSITILCSLMYIKWELASLRVCMQTLSAMRACVPRNLTRTESTITHGQNAMRCGASSYLLFVGLRTWRVWSPNCYTTRLCELHDAQLIFWEHTHHTCITYLCPLINWYFMYRFSLFVARAASGKLQR